MNSALVFHHGALGDGVLTWPLLRGMGPVTLIGSGEKTQLAARRLPGITAVDGDGPAFSRLFAPEPAGELRGPAYDLLARAARIVSFISDGRDAWAENVAAAAPRAARYFLRSRPDPDHRIPVAEYHAMRLADQGWTVQPRPAPRRVNPGGPIVIHPGGGGREKCWPIDRFEQLIDRLAGAGRPVIVALGEVERDRFDAHRLDRWRRCYDVHEPARLIDLADLLAGASVFIGNDSGPTHLAAQLGVGTVAIFGPTDPRVWGPAGPAVTILHPEEPMPMDWLPVELVADAVNRW